MSCRHQHAPINCASIRLVTINSLLSFFNVTVHMYVLSVVACVLIRVCLSAPLSDADDASDDEKPESSQESGVSGDVRMALEHFLRHDMLVLC